MLNMTPHRIPPQVYFALCDAAGLKSVDIARKLDVTRAAVSQWRSGVHNMDDQNYRRLEALALTSESRILALYRAANQPDGVASPEDGTLLLTQGTPADYPQRVARIFQAQLGELQRLTSGDVATWDCEAVRAYSEDIASMARAVTAIMEDRRENAHA